METNKPVGLDQLSKLLLLMSQKGMDANRLQALIGSGILADLFELRSFPPRARDKVEMALGPSPFFRFMRTIALTNQVDEVWSKLKGRSQYHLSFPKSREKGDLATVLSRVEKLAVSKATLVFPTVADLGLPDGTLYADAAERGQDLGFNLCPPEIGIQLPLQDDTFADWLYGQRMFVMMTPLTEDGYRSYYSISRLDQPHLECLSIAWGEVEHKGNPLLADQRCVFLLKTE
jgi:hypothetical protein